MNNKAIWKILEHISLLHEELLNSLVILELLPVVGLRNSYLKKGVQECYEG